MKAIYFFFAVMLLSTLSSLAQTWHSLENGVNAVVFCIEPYGADDPDSRDIYIGGNFTNAGGLEDADHIAMWNGTDWHAVAPGLNGSVFDIAFSGENIYVAGAFTNAGGNPGADNIAYWDGTVWHSLGFGLNNRVFDIAIDGNRIYAAGEFSNPDGHINYIAYWDGTAWQALGTGLNQPANAIAIDGQDVYVGGWFSNAGGNENADRIARWDGNKWNALATGLDGAVTDIELSNGYLYAGGLFTQNVLRWNGYNWNSLGQGPATIWGEITELAISGNVIYAAAFVDGIYHWDGEEWAHLANWPELESAFSIAINDSEVYVGGEFYLGSTGTNNIARFYTGLTGAKDSPVVNTNDLKLYPNPANDQLSYTLSNRDQDLVTHQLELRDATGKVLLSRISDESKLDISELSPGVYFLQVRYNGQRRSAKVVKK